MVNVKVVAVLVMVASLVASAGMAQAGGGGEGLGDNPILFNCYLIHQGANPGHVVSVNDQFTNAHDVRVGKAKLLCTPASASPVSGPVLLATPEPTHITCYDTNPDPDAGALVQLQDSFGVQTVRVSQPKFLCVGSVKECLDDGCPINDPLPE
jgi:hypothetical protein